MEIPIILKVPEVVNCARCKGNHAAVLFDPLTYPISDTDGTQWTHWTPCPTNGEPVLLKASSNEPEIAEDTVPVNNR